MYPQQDTTHTIYFIRHGQTNWNVAGRKQGQTNIPLNEVGRAQASRNGKMLRSLLGESVREFDFVSSPLIRCRETMEIIRQELGLPPHGYRTDRRLMEINYGKWQGATWDELSEKEPEHVRARFEDPWNTVAPGGENFAQLSHRCLEWLFETQHDTIVVGHGGVNRCFRGYLESIEQIKIPHMDVPQDRIMQIAGENIDWH